MDSTIARLMVQRINVSIAAGEAGTARDEIPFICECEATPCYAPVWLTRAEYDALREEGLPVLKADHHAQERAPVIPLPERGLDIDRRLAS
jgi:hypothetical protein